MEVYSKIGLDFWLPCHLPCLPNGQSDTE